MVSQTNSALILIDLQNDFFPGGALGVSKANEILPIVNAVQSRFNHVVATKDWHPLNHASFAVNQQKNVGDVILLNTIEQILWPVHCVQHTLGAEFHLDLNTSSISKIIYKGTHADVDSYSGFFDNHGVYETGLHSYLQSLGITRLYLAGLATDYCVKFTCLDACKLGYKTYVIQDACRGVGINPHDIDDALDEMQKAGAELIYSNTLITG